MSPRPAAHSFNFNSVLLTIVLLLSGWTLKTVYELATTAAATAQQVQQRGRDIDRLDTRMGVAETQITDLRVRAGVASRP